MKQLVYVSVAALLVACGGGGGGGDDGPAPPPLGVPLNTAMKNYVEATKTSSFNVSGSVRGQGLTVAITGQGTAAEATANGSFEGRTAFRKTTTTRATISGTAQGQTLSETVSGSTDEWFDSTYKLVGQTEAGVHCVASSTAVLPATTPLGTSGTFATFECYSSSAKTTRLGTSTLTYSVDPDPSSAAHAILSLRATSSIAGAVTSVNTFRVDGQGAISRLRTTGGFALDGAVADLSITYQ